MMDSTLRAHWYGCYGNILLVFILEQLTNTKLLPTYNHAFNDVSIAMTEGTHILFVLSLYIYIYIFLLTFCFV